MRIPKYMKNFKCIGSACEDNCCIGWDVDIDKVTFIKYQKVSHPLMKRELTRYVKINPEVYSDSINYAFAVLTPEKHCSFLNADRLCMIQKHLGESFLSNVCDSFPRITNIIDGGIERSATPSCPEVMRLLAENPDAMAIEKVKDPLSTPIVSFDIKQSDKRFKGTLISSLLEVRDACLSRFESNEELLETQLLNLGQFIVEIVALEKKGKLSDLKTVLDRHVSSQVETSSSDTNAFFDFSERLIKHLEHVGADDSVRYIEMSERASQGDVTVGSEQFEVFNQRYPHVIRNLMKNHIYKSLFPFSEGENAEEALWLLLCRYAMIKRQLIGLGGFHNQLTLDIVTEYLQVFSKVIEHHKHFEVRTIEALKSQKMNSRKLMEIVLHGGIKA